MFKQFKKVIRDLQVESAGQGLNSGFRTVVVVQHVEEAEETPEAKTSSQTNGQIEVKIKPTNKVRGRKVTKILTTDADTSLRGCADKVYV